MIEIPERLLWLDLETTGGNEDVDVILEIGCAISSPDDQDRRPLARVIDTFSATIRPGGSGTERGEPHMMALRALAQDEVVRAMHDKNNLWHDVIAHGRPLEIVEANVLRWLNQYFDPVRKVPLAGSGVSHFDRRFIRRYMPTLDLRLTYWAIDVGAVRRFFALAGVDVSHLAASIEAESNGDDKAHRGLPDALAHMREARAYAGLLNDLPL